jgi:hypothetical protein
MSVWNWLLDWNVILKPLELTKKIPSTEMGTTSQTSVIAIFVVQSMAMKMLRSGKRFPAVWEAASELLLHSL